MSEIKKLIYCITLCFLLKNCAIESSILRQISDNGTNQANETAGLIFIDNSTSDIILAEPNTLASLKETTIVIKSDVNSDFDIDVEWSIQPIDNRRFQNSGGIATISRNTSSAKILIRTKNTDISSLNEISYKFSLNRIFINDTKNKNKSFSIKPSASVISIRILPSNFPFGIFQFSDVIPVNLTLSR